MIFLLHHNYSTIVLNSTQKKYWNKIFLKAFFCNRVLFNYYFSIKNIVFKFSYSISLYNSLLLDLFLFSGLKLFLNISFIFHFTLHLRSQKVLLEFPIVFGSMGVSMKIWNVNTKKNKKWQKKSQAM